MAVKNPVPGTNGDQYIPYAARTGEASTVYFTRDLSAEGLRRIFSRIRSNLSRTGRTSSHGRGWRHW